MRKTAHFTGLHGEANMTWMPITRHGCVTEQVNPVFIKANIISLENEFIRIVGIAVNQHENPLAG